jgi:hypothetical protein
MAALGAARADDAAVAKRERELWLSTLDDVDPRQLRADF